MKAEHLQLALRPRRAFEAVDLGVRMTQAAAPSLLRAYVPFALLLAVACLSTLELAAWLPAVLLFWFRPWLERGLLFVYARQAFGERTSFAQAWTARADAPWWPLLQALAWGRVSRFRPFLAPVQQLEGQSGAARRRRAKQLLNGQRGAVIGVSWAFVVLETTLVLGGVAAICTLLPGVDLDDFRRLLVDTSDDSFEKSLVLTLAYAATLLFITPFHVAAGFAMYLNRRADLEAWDVEQDLRAAFAGPAA